MTVNENTPQTASRAAMVGEAMKAPSGNQALKREALAQPGHNLESVGAAHHIKATRSVGVDQAILRTGVVRSIPVSTDWAAIEDAFSSRTVVNDLWESNRTEGGTD